jgi:hypothetical protein
VSAKELLEQVSIQLKQLPPEEREAFLDGIADLDGGSACTERPSMDKPLAWPDIHLRHQRIFGQTVLPENAVLAARDEEDS